MQNPKQNFRQSSIIFEKPGSLSEKLKTLTSSNYRRVSYFLLEFGNMEGCSRLFLFRLDLELLKKLVSVSV